MNPKSTYSLKVYVQLPDGTYAWCTIRNSFDSKEDAKAWAEFAMPGLYVRVQEGLK